MIARGLWAVIATALLLALLLAISAATPTGTAGIPPSTPRPATGLVPVPSLPTSPPVAIPYPAPTKAVPTPEPTPRPTPSPTPSPTPRPTPKPTVRPHVAVGSVSGVATWYCDPAWPSPCTAGFDWRGAYAAAGPELRAALGDWRGRTVYVNGVRLTVVDFCACGGNHVIDVYHSTWTRIPNPGSVTITW